MPDPRRPVRPAPLRCPRGPAPDAAGRRERRGRPSRDRVTRAQRGDPNLVRPATVDKVRAVAKELGYQVNPIARSLKTSRSETVGVLIPDMTNPLFPPIVRGSRTSWPPAATPRCPPTPTTTPTGPRPASR